MSLYLGHCTIRGIFFSEFHPKAGPKILYQTPEDYISKKDFDMVQVYIITKPQLQGKIITLNAPNHKFVGCPVCLDNPKYARNALIFNICFVFDSNVNTVCYEAVVKKLAGYFTTLEEESEFLSNEETCAKLPQILCLIREELNSKGSSYVFVNESTTLHMKVTPICVDPPVVHPHQVPILTVSTQKLQLLQTQQHWDLATQQLIPHIDGYKPVRSIAAEADMDPNIVRICLQNLLYYDVIKLISVFQYSNVYTTTPNITKLMDDEEMQRQCLDFVSRPSRQPSMREIMLMYCGLTAGTTVQALCSRYNSHAIGVDERKLIQFGLIEGLIRRMEKYPVKLPRGSSSHHGIDSLYNGCHSYDEICCLKGWTYQELEDRVESDPSIVVCWK